MHCSYYLRNGIVILPTMGVVGRYLHRVVEPVAVIPVDDTEALRQAFKDTIARGNPQVPPVDYSKPGRVLLLAKYAGVKSRAAFERGAFTWSIGEKDGHYSIYPGRKCADGGWEDDRDNGVELPAGATIDELCAQAVAIVQAKARSLAPTSTA